MNIVKKSRCPKCEELGKDRKGDNLVSYSDGHSYCYGCGYTVTNGSVRINRFNDRNNKQAKVVFLPSDCEFKYPQEAIDWVGQYELGVSHLLKHRVMWSASKQRLIFPVIGGEGEYLATVQRNFDKANGGPKWITFGDLNSTYHILGKGDPVVLCEDIVSAIKLSAICTAMPIFGNHIGLTRFKRLYQIVPRGSTIAVWLDPDMRARAVRESALGASVGLNTRVIISDKDPKEHSFSEIKEIIG